MVTKYGERLYLGSWFLVVQILKKLELILGLSSAMCAG